MESNIEYIIRHFRYFELNESQKEEISKWAKTSDEFEALKCALHATDALTRENDDTLNPIIKQRLDVRFAEKHKQERLVWYNKLWIFLWPTEASFYKRPLIQITAICLISVFTIPFFPRNEQQQLAMNESTQKVQKDQTDKVDSLSSDEHKPKKIDEDEVLNENNPDNREKASKREMPKQTKSSIKDDLGSKLKKSGKDVSQDIEKLSGNINIHSDDMSNEEIINEDKKDFSIDLKANAPTEELGTSTLNSTKRADAKKVNVDKTLDLLTALH